MSWKFMTPKNFAPFLTIFTKKSNTQSQNEPFLRCWNCYFYSINEELCCSSKFIEKRRESGMRLSRACVKHVSKFLRKSLAVLDAVWFRWFCQFLSWSILMISAKWCLSRQNSLLKRTLWLSLLATVQKSITKFSEQNIYWTKSSLQSFIRCFSSGTAFF